MRVLVYSHLALLVLCVLLSGARRAAAGAWCLFSPDSDAISSTPRCDGIPRLADKISGPQRRSPPSASVRQQQAAVGSTRYTNQADIRVEEVIVRNGNWTVVFLKDWKIELRLNNERMNMIDFGDKVSTLARTYGATSMVFLDDYIEMLYNSSVRLRAEYDWGFPMERMELGSDGNLRFFTTADGRNDSNGKPLPNRVAYTMTSIRNVHFPDYNTFFRKPVRVDAALRPDATTLYPHEAEDNCPTNFKADNVKLGTGFNLFHMCDLASVVQFSSRCNRSNEGILYPAPGVVEIRDLIQNRTAQKFTNRSQMFDMSLGFSISQTGLGSAGMKIKNWLNSKRITTLITMDYVTEYFNGRVQYSKLGPEDLNPRFREKFLNLPERFDPTNRTNVDLFDSFYTSFGGHFVSDVTYGTRVTVTKHSSDCTQTSGTSLTLDILADISSQVPGLNFGAAPSWSNNATMQEVLRGSTNYLCGYPFSCTNGIFGCGPTNTTDTRPVYERMVSVSFHVRPIEDAALVMKDLVREGDPRLRAFKNYTQKYEETFAETVQPVRCGVPRGLVWSWAVAAVASITAATALL